MQAYLSVTLIRPRVHVDQIDSLALGRLAQFPILTGPFWRKRGLGTEISHSSAPADAS
jgi:hypothetical protein